MTHENDLNKKDTLMKRRKLSSYRTIYQSSSLIFTMLITSMLHGLKIRSLQIGMGKISHYACWPARETNQDDKTCVTMAMTATMLE